MRSTCLWRLGRNTTSITWTKWIPMTRCMAATQSSGHKLEQLCTSVLDQLLSHLRALGEAGHVERQARLALGASAEAGDRSKLGETTALLLGGQPVGPGSSKCCPGSPCFGALPRVCQEASKQGWKQGPLCRASHQVADPFAGLRPCPIFALCSRNRTRLRRLC
ncbi:hypothetical protein MRX96_039378 [Rhipicephalus microplus]